MPFVFHDGVAQRSISAVTFHDGVAQRSIKEAWFHDGTAVRKVFSSAAPLTVSAAGVDRSEFAPEPAPASRQVSGTTTAVVSGGSGSYTYSWAFVASGAGISITNGNTATPTFSGNVTKNGILSGTARVTVNDGSTVAAFDIPVSLAYLTDL